jgi:type I restriction enzyme S subunit
MERYSEYKDCGVHWLGEIPSHWEVVPLKYYTDIIMGQSPSGDDIKDNGHLLFMQGNAEFGRKYPSTTSYCDNCNKQSRVGDILMSVRAPVGALNVSDKVYGIGRGLCSIKPVGIKLDYLWYYLIVARQGFKEVSTGSTYDSVSTDTLRSIRLVLPTQKEQQAIACYLDSVTDKIDEAIAQQQRMIDLLNERKQIIINNAVTKGLNIKAAMKDSGVDWIGEIPEHWDIKRGKFLFDIINEYSSTGEEELLTVSDRTGITPRSMKNVTMFMAESLVGYKKCKIGDICSNIMWMWHGAVGVTKYDGVISPSYGVYRQKNLYYNGEYLDMLLRLPQLVKFYASRSTGLTESRLRLYPDDFMNIYFFVPPIEEQEMIVKRLKTICEPIESAIDAATQQIYLLQERKQIIINDVVTGKVKVS